MATPKFVLAASFTRILIAVHTTEQLNVKNMTASGGAYKKGLNRSILDAAPSTFINLLKTKAEEAGSLWVEVPTRQVKPSQTCHRCGSQRKKLLSERKHQCDCSGGERLLFGREEPRNSTYSRLSGLSGVVH